MIMRRLATLCLLCLATTVRSQDRGVLKVQDGVEVGYELQLLGKDEKRDRYRITVTATHKGGSDIYYAVAKKPQPNGTSGLGRSDDRHFAEVMVNNPASFKDIFSANAKLAGEQTSEETTRNEILFRIPKGSVIRREFDFVMKPGKRPEMSCNFGTALRSRESLLGVPGSGNGGGVDGMWTSGCGNVRMQLTQRRNDRGQTELVQGVNGRTNVWLQLSEGIYERPGRPGARLTYDRISGRFTYTHTDGVVCQWTRS